ncbi:hypothetical protein DMENIID0001_084270 [Sergentomyia squamirostris]
MSAGAAELINYSAVPRVDLTAAAGRRCPICGVSQLIDIQSGHWRELRFRGALRRKDFVNGGFHFVKLSELDFVGGRFLEVDGVRRAFSDLGCPSVRAPVDPAVGFSMMETLSTELQCRS